MAMSKTLVFGRIGALAGSNIAGVLLDNSSDSMYIIAAAALFICAVLSFYVSSNSSSRQESR